MPHIRETQPSPPRTNNPYTHTENRNSSNSNSAPQTRIHNTNTQRDLTSWLTTARNNPAASPNFQRQRHKPPSRIIAKNRLRTLTTTTQHNPETPPTPTDTPLTPQALPPNQQTITYPPGIQTTLDPPTHNNHWGDPLYPVPTNTFRIISKNMNSLPTTDNFLHWRAATAAAQETDAQVMCFQETNLRWDHNNHTKVTQIFRKNLQSVKISVSSSNEPSAKEYQPGGTFTATFGSLTSRVILTGSDASGLGSWSYITMRLSNDRKLTILSGYRVCDQNPTLGSRTSYNQQLRLLTAAGHFNPDPRKHFFMDLIPLIQQWRAQRHEVIICLDVNENTSILNPTEDLGLLLSKTDLVDLHTYRHPTFSTPATHQRGSATIDAILGSPQVAQALRGAFYLPHGEPLSLSGDHRTLGVDIDTTILFDNKLPPMMNNYHRGVNSNAYPTVPEFCKEVVTQCENQKKNSALKCYLSSD